KRFIPMSIEKPKSKKMTQSQVVKHFAERFNLESAQAENLFASLVELASTQLKETGEFQVPGFGKLVLRRTVPRVGRNPFTGETIQIKAKTAVKFRLSNSLKISALPGDSTIEIPPRGK